MRLNLGAGSKSLSGYVNVDRVQLPGINVVHDLDVTPWPWEDGSADRITAIDVFEHVADAIAFMAESHRILKAGGILFMRTPHISSLDAFTDPTHKRFPTQYTWDYWIPGTVLFASHNAAYGGVSFTSVDHEMVDGQQQVTLRRA